MHMHRIAWPGCAPASSQSSASPGGHPHVCISHSTRITQKSHSTSRRSQAITALGALKAPKGVVRSHVVIRKGGEVASLRIKISPGDSVAEGLETILDIASK